MELLLCKEFVEECKYDMFVIGCVCCSFEGFNYYNERLQDFSVATGNIMNLLGLGIQCI